MKDCDDVIVHIKKEGKTMREIKFRGKRIDTGEWVYGSLVQQFDEENRVHTAIVAYSECWMAFVTTWVISKTVGQYTGVKDKNGVDVYEGDIVNIPAPIGWDSGGIKNIFGKIIWCEYFLPWKFENNNGLDDIVCDFCVDGVGKFKVIGNIYDNPELKREANKNEQRL